MCFVLFCLNEPIFTCKFLLTVCNLWFQVCGAAFNRPVFALKLKKQRWDGEKSGTVQLFLNVCSSLGPFRFFLLLIFSCFFFLNQQFEMDRGSFFWYSGAEVHSGATCSTLRFFRFYMQNHSFVLQPFHYFNLICTESHCKVFTINSHKLFYKSFALTKCCFFFFFLNFVQHLRAPWHSLRFSFLFNTV